MERLTERKEDRGYLEDEFWVSAKEPSVEEIDKVYQRLAEYEDKLESGQLVELKFYIGQPIYLVDYILNSPAMAKCKIKECYAYRGHTYVDIVGDCEQALHNNYDITTNARGFIFTEQEAESRLKELRGE